MTTNEPYDAEAVRVRMNAETNRTRPGATAPTNEQFDIAIELVNARAEVARLTEERDTARKIADNAIEQASREKLLRESSESERALERRRADQAWDVIHTDYWRNHYDELAAEAVKAQTERDGLAAVIDAGKYTFGSESDNRFGFTPIAATDPTATLAARDAEKKAEAWDEGYSAGVSMLYSASGAEIPNPYRTPRQGEPDHG